MPVFFVLIAIVRPPEIGWAGFVFAVAAISDWWDGHMARKMGLVSELGAFLDPLADKLLTGTAFVAFAWMDIIPWWMVGIILARDIDLTLLRSFAEKFGHPVKTSYVAKVKTFAQMAFIILLLVELYSQKAHFGIGLAGIAQTFFAADISFWLMGLVTLLTFASAVMYSFDNGSTIRSVAARYFSRRTGQETT